MTEDRAFCDRRQRGTSLALYQDLAIRTAFHRQSVQTLESRLDEMKNQEREQEARIEKLEMKAKRLQHQLLQLQRERRDLAATCADLGQTVRKFARCQRATALELARFRIRHLTIRATSLTGTIVRLVQNLSRPSQPIRATIDSVRALRWSDDGRCWLDIEGWAISEDSRIVEVCAVIANRRPISLRYGFPRPDVARVYPRIPLARLSGFWGRFEVPSTSTWETMGGLQVQDATGRIAWLPAKSENSTLPFRLAGGGPRDTETRLNPLAEAV
jgi:hypothetical protein